MSDNPSAAWKQHPAFRLGRRGDLSPLATRRWEEGGDALMGWRGLWAGKRHAEISQACAKGMGVPDGCHEPVATEAWAKAAMRAIGSSEPVLVGRMLCSLAATGERWLNARHPVHWILSAGNHALLDAYLSQGGDRIEIRGDTPLHLAMRRKDVKALSIMVSHGMDIEGKDSVGYTALQRAVMRCQPEEVSVLLALGADRMIRDKHGMSLAGMMVRREGAPVWKKYMVASPRAQETLRLLVQEGISIDTPEGKTGRAATVREVLFQMRAGAVVAMLDRALLDDALQQEAEASPRRRRL